MGRSSALKGILKDERKHRGVERKQQEVERGGERSNGKVVERHHPQESYVAARPQVQCSEAPLPGPSVRALARRRPLLVGSSSRSGAPVKVSGAASVARASICMRTSADSEGAVDVAVASSKKTSSDSGIAEDAPVSTSKKTGLDSRLPQRTSKESRRKSEVSKGESQKVDSTVKKRKQKITWVDHKGASLTSCCPLDVDAPHVRPFELHIPPPPLL